MTIAATYDATLSRVQIAKSAVANPLNSNPTFEVNSTGWTSLGGTFARSTAQFHSGVASGLLTPTGTPSYPGAFFTAATSPTCYPGEELQWSVWVRSATGHNVTISINWLDSSDAAIGLDLLTVSTVINTWTPVSMTAIAPEGAAKAQGVVANTGASVAADLLYIDDCILSVTKFVVERSPNQITWTRVRGGAAAVGGVSGTANDYEFAEGVVNYYRIRGETDSITPTLDGVWLKSITRPFLNRKIGKHGLVDGVVSRAPRRGLFDVKGRTAPVAVTDVRGGKEFGLRVITDDRQEGYYLDYMMASGDILLLHAPAASRVPTAYVAPGNVSSKYHGVSEIQTWLMEMTEVQAPGPEVVGATVTWGTIIADFATWSAVIAFFPTWDAVLSYVADPAEVIVS